MPKLPLEGPASSLVPGCCPPGTLFLRNGAHGPEECRPEIPRAALPGNLVNSSSRAKLWLMKCRYMRYGKLAHSLAPLAQLAEHLTLNQRVRGSSPRGGTKAPSSKELQAKNSWSMPTWPPGPESAFSVRCLTTWGSDVPGQGDADFGRDGSLEVRHRVAGKRLVSGTAGFQCAKEIPGWHLPGIELRGPHSGRAVSDGAA